jgi:hypothetical protein
MVGDLEDKSLVKSFILYLGKIYLTGKDFL